jgi:hypothetical protein
MPSPKVASARVRANRQARVVLNRAALDEIQLRIADGLLGWGEKVLAEAVANAPRDPEKAAERGVPMMADTGHVLVYALGKKVGGETGETGKPRSMKAGKDQVVVGVWFSSPIAHFAEIGTIKERARPFLTPAILANATDAGGYVEAAMAKRSKAAG